MGAEEVPGGVFLLGNSYWWKKIQKNPKICPKNLEKTSKSWIFKKLIDHQKFLYPVVKGL